MDEIITENAELLTESETTIPELDSIMSQVSEINSYMAVTADNIEVIKVFSSFEFMLTLAVIVFIGIICGLLIINIIRK